MGCMNVPQIAWLLYAVLYTFIEMTLNMLYTYLRNILLIYNMLWIESPLPAEYHRVYECATDRMALICSTIDIH